MALEFEKGFVNNSSLLPVPSAEAAGVDGTTYGMMDASPHLNTSTSMLLGSFSLFAQCLILQHLSMCLDFSQHGGRKTWYIYTVTSFQQAENGSVQAS